MNAPQTDAAWDAAAPPLSRRGILILRTRQQRDRRRLLVAGAVMGILLLLTIAAALIYGGSSESPAGPTASAGAVERMRLPSAVAESAVIYDTAVMPLAPAEASAINAERPLDVENLVPARALRVAAESTSGPAYGAALRCLTQAVYYEAASERDEGQRAVAQVVLNRVQHPAFPNTVCGVVFQGSERVTGCQFSFTCDGSLARVPSAGGWARAERVARDALAGTVAAAVGHATHYHADYVVPYWAPTLDKAATIGTHIFYIIRGFLGSPRAFSSRYDVTLEAASVPLIAETEMLPSAGPGLLEVIEPVTTLVPGLGVPAADARSGNLVAAPETSRFGAAAPAALRADEQAGELKAEPGGALRADERPGPGGPPRQPQD